MTQPRDLDPIIATWLDDGPIDLPADTRRAIVVGLRTQPRVRRMANLRGLPMNTFSRLATAAGIVLVVGAVSMLALANRGGGPGGLPAASPTPSPTIGATAGSPVPSPSARLLDTTGWTMYVSGRYGFSVGRPTNWTVEPATRNWIFANDLKAWEHLESTEHFNNAEGSVGVSGWSSTVAAGMTVAAYIDAYCRGLNNTNCAGLANRAVNVTTGDGHQGLGLFVNDFDTMTFFVDGRTMYVVGLWRGEDDPTVQPYGGARRLLESIVSTMTIQGPPQGSPGAS